MNVIQPNEQKVLLRAIGRATVPEVSMRNMSGLDRLLRISMIERLHNLVKGSEVPWSSQLVLVHGGRSYREVCSVWTLVQALLEIKVAH